MKTTAAIVVVAASLGALAWSQSLEELAQKEKARRKAAGTARTFTNDDLAKPSPSPSPAAEGEETTGGHARRRYQVGRSAPAAPQGEATSSEGSSREGRREDRSVEGEPSEGDAGSEAYWRGRAQALRETIDTTQKSIAAVEARIGQLALDRDPNPSDQFDPNRLQKRDAERLKLIDEVEKSKATLASQQQALADLADEARRKGAPSGWVR